ncbi:O-antigen ligase family protein [Rhodocyclus tenuis]|uniref:O-antigen ligase n=1 Tax=Rhodocyclus tenuis TaxID=1066 RepID=A0A840G8E8_RHOTE|nr:O-antigen ligase family protein [Rhodocyclus tenuis]MBB4247200.1 O-antigen ligase [Rhodocyclus tenuis]
MSILEIVYPAVYFAMAFGAAILLVLAFGVSLHVEGSWGARFVPAIAPLIVLGIALSSLLSGRNLAMAAQHIDLLAEQPGGGASILRLITLSILCIAGAKLVGAFTRRRALSEAPGSALFVSLLIYIVASNLLPSAFGTVPTFVHSLFYSLVIFAAVWAARREPLETMIKAAKAALYVLLVGSLVAALLVPAIALQPDYQGLIPGLHVRLWGLGSNANSIGPLAMLTLLLEYLLPTRNRRLRALLITAAVLVFILAQSKTVWFALLIVLAILAWYRWPLRAGRQAALLLALVMITVLSAGLLAVMFVDLPSLWDRISDSKVGDSVATVSGRTGIWEVALREWQHSPLFGYGPTIWGEKFRWQIGMPYAFSAHNQFMQTLSVAGTLGFLALLAYLRYLIPAALRMAAQTRGVSVALLAMILLRCFSEAPLAMTGLIDGDALTHLLLFAIVLRAPARELRRSEAQVVPAGLRA